MKDRCGISDEKVAELLGGFIKNYKNKSISYFVLGNNDLVSMKYSHLYKNGIEYWFGITPSTLYKYKNEGTTFICLILGYEGVLKVPFDVISRYIENSDTTKKQDGKIKIYHVRIRYDEDILLYNSIEKIVVNNYFFYDEDTVIAELDSKSKDQLRKEAERFKDYEKQYVKSDAISKRRNESKAQKERIAALEDHTCQVCGFYQEYRKASQKHFIINVDHIIDKAKGGGETLDNLWVLCPNCHAKKTFGLIKIDKEQKKVTEGGKKIQIRDNHLNW